MHKKNPYSDMLAREALKILSSNILRATYGDNDLDARQAMLFGACLAGQAFANAPVAAVHALAYPLGGHYHIPHGLSNSLVLPSVLRFNAPNAQALYAELAEVIQPTTSDHSESTERCDEFVSYFEDLIKKLKLPSTLSDAGVPEADLPCLCLLYRSPSPRDA